MLLSYVQSDAVWHALRPCPLVPGVLPRPGKMKAKVCKVGKMNAKEHAAGEYSPAVASEASALDIYCLR